MFTDFDLWKDGNCFLCDVDLEDAQEEDGGDEEVEVEDVNKEESSELILEFPSIFEKFFDEDLDSFIV